MTRSNWDHLVPSSLRFSTSRPRVDDARLHEELLALKAQLVALCDRLAVEDTNDFITRTALQSLGWDLDWTIQHVERRSPQLKA